MKNLEGKFITSKVVVGEVVGLIVDEGDYGVNVQELLVVENALGDHYQVGINSVKEVSYSDYLDLVGLRYGVFY